MENNAFVRSMSNITLSLPGSTIDPDKPSRKSLYGGRGCEKLLRCEWVGVGVTIERTLQRGDVTSGLCAAPGAYQKVDVGCPQNEGWACTHPAPP